MTLDLRETLEAMCGSEILAISVEEHAANGSRSPLSVWVALHGRGFRFRTAPNGWGLEVDATPPSPTDLGQHGRLEVTETKRFGNLRPGVVRAAWVVLSSESAVPVGVRWCVDESEAVVVYSYDDAFFVAPAPSPELGTITYDEVCGVV